MRVLKFGGTSVGSVESLGHVCEIVARAAPCAVVVSALSQVTDGLLGLAHRAAGSGRVDDAALDALIRRHHETARAVVSPDELDAVLAEIDAELSRFAEVVRGIALVGEA
ncbi:MAG: bifunctional aspartate kinase/homoserine dehydrogenase I, partial [Gemmatimonadetes bacterium]|nr:bifunctional aspartate kinase/homoserine dehydrogenase I [Gemmatimonadota bacterium]